MTKLTLDKETNEVLRVMVRRALLDGIMILSFMFALISFMFGVVFLFSADWVMTGLCAMLTAIFVAFGMLIYKLAPQRLIAEISAEGIYIRFSMVCQRELSVGKKSTLYTYMSA